MRFLFSCFIGAALGDSALPVKAGVSYRSRSSSTSPRNSNGNHIPVFDTDNVHLSTRSSKETRSGSLDSILDDTQPSSEHRSNGANGVSSSRRQQYHQNGGDSRMNGGRSTSNGSLREAMLTSESAYEISMSPLFIHSPDSGQKYVVCPANSVLHLFVAFWIRFTMGGHRDLTRVASFA